MIDRRDDTESDIETKELARLQTEARELFEKYNFAPFNPKEEGGANESKVHWIIDGVMEIDADTNEAAEAR